MSTRYRMNRLFDAASGNCFDVAIDHGFFNQRRFLTGIEDAEAAVRTVVAAAPDAVQLTVGQAPLLQALPGKAKPALVLRTDVANVYGDHVPTVAYSRLIDDPVEQALRLDAACVVVNLFGIPGMDELQRACLDNILRLKPACERFGMPLMVEPLVMKVGEGGGYQVDGDLDSILPLVRQATELGADIIKADPCDDPSEYHQVVQVARVPVLVRGGGRVPDDELLRRTEALMRQGARGIVYGRNVIQHRDPAAMTRALMSVVHEGASAEQAVRLLGAARA